MASFLNRVLGIFGFVEPRHEFGKDWNRFIVRVVGMSRDERDKFIDLAHEYRADVRFRNGYADALFGVSDSEYAEDMLGAAEDARLGRRVVWIERDRDGHVVSRVKMPRSG